MAGISQILLLLVYSPKLAWVNHRYLGRSFANHPEMASIDSYCLLTNI